MNGPRDDQSSSSALVVVAVLEFVLLTPPLLSIFNRGDEILGVPRIWAYIFLAWASIISLIAVLVRRLG